MSATGTRRHLERPGIVLGRLLGSNDESSRLRRPARLDFRQYRGIPSPEFVIHLTVVVETTPRRNLDSDSDTTMPENNARWCHVRSANLTFNPRSPVESEPRGGPRTDLPRPRCVHEGRFLATIGLVSQGNYFVPLGVKNTESCREGEKNTESGPAKVSRGESARGR